MTTVLSVLKLLSVSILFWVVLMFGKSNDKIFPKYGPSDSSSYCTNSWTGIVLPLKNHS